MTVLLTEQYCSVCEVVHELFSTDVGAQTPVLVCFLAEPRVKDR